MNRPWLLLAGLCLSFTSARAADPAPMPVAELAARQADGRAPALILDTRTQAEFDAGHVPGARLVPHDAIDVALATLAPYRDAEIVIYCRSGRRSTLAESTLRDHGFRDITQLDGSWLAWQQAGLPVESTLMAAAP